METNRVLCTVGINFFRLKYRLIPVFANSAQVYSGRLCSTVVSTFESKFYTSLLVSPAHTLPLIFNPLSQSKHSNRAFPTLPTFRHKAAVQLQNSKLEHSDVSPNTRLFPQLHLLHLPRRSPASLLRLPETKGITR
jgi:hypothetical protein